MAIKHRTTSFRSIERLFGEGVVAGCSDAELVERFTTKRDADAFAAIVARHGPMVMAVCRGHLSCCGADADDAFQATFVVFMNRAGSFSVGPSLGGWLYRVARRVARQVRLAEARRRKREQAAACKEEPTVEDHPERSEIIRLIRQEIDRLPHRYRTPIMLCDLQGLTREEAAGLLGWPAGTVGGRLARARRQLRERLERRGVAPSVAMPIFSETSPAAGAWRSSLEAAIRRASSLAAGNPATPAVFDLAARAGRRLVGLTVKLAVVAGLGAVAIGGLAAARNMHERQTPPTAAAGAKQPSKPAAESDPDDPKLAGHFAGRVIGPDGEPVAGAKLFITQNESWPMEAGPVRATSGADGRFEFDAADMTYVGIDGLPMRRMGLLIATGDQYQPAWAATWGQARGVRAHLRSDPVKGADLTIRLARGDVPIHGRLLDPDGQPLAGARVGLCSLKVPPEGEFDADLKRFEGVKGKGWPFNYDRSVHEPIVLPGVATEASTDADGRFLLAGLGRDRLAELKITAPGVVDTYLRVMTRDAPDLKFGSRTILGAGFTFRLKPGRTVRGIVRDRETRAPIAGMWVGEGAGALSGLTGAPSRFSSDANGRYEISGIDPSARDLEVMAVPQPGQPYMMATAKVGERSGAMIDCLRGIPFRLKLVDEAGRPEEGEVEFRPVMPNPYAVSVLPHDWTFGTFPLTRAVMTAKGVYEGVVIAGPGAVMVKTPGWTDYRAAHVDPKAFFAPGRTDWTNQELITAYGTDDTLIIGNAWVDQHDYAAIVLVNPPKDSKPLELFATVVRDQPRQVTILDPEGRPLVGVQTQGLTAFPWDEEPTLRGATVPITKLHPTRSRRITFLKEDRKLIGFLLARGDGDTPYTVKLEPWATVTGRIVDENGEPLPAKDALPGRNPASVGLAMNAKLEIATHADPRVGTFPDCGSDGEGRFRIERLVPGLRYSCDIYREGGGYAGQAFEDLVLKPGETRNLGDIRWKTTVDVRGK
jgi:RNA polymerase sigma factor (sigma-70 family)